MCERNPRKERRTRDTGEDTDGRFYEPVIRREDGRLVCCHLFSINVSCLLVQRLLLSFSASGSVRCGLSVREKARGGLHCFRRATRTAPLAVRHARGAPTRAAPIQHALAQ